jgi:chromate transporter
LLLPDLPAGSPVLPPAPAEPATATTPVSINTTLTTVVTWLVIWFAPVAAIALLIYPDHLLVDIGLFFSKLAVVTFGGAYAVLAYMGQQAVETHNWLTADQMIDGLGLAETTPGPLILVTEFVGYMAGFRSAGLLGSVSMGLAAAAMALWVTFAPCFLWIFAGAPYVERLAKHAQAQCGAGGHHRGSRRRYCQPCTVVRPARDVCQGRRIEAGPLSMTWPQWSPSTLQQLHCSPVGTHVAGASSGPCPDTCRVRRPWPCSGLGRPAVMVVQMSSTNTLVMIAR